MDLAVIPQTRYQYSTYSIAILLSRIPIHKHVPRVHVLLTDPIWQVVCRDVQLNQKKNHVIFESRFRNAAIFSRLEPTVSVQLSQKNK